MTNELRLRKKILRKKIEKVSLVMRQDHVYSVKEVDKGYQFCLCHDLILIYEKRRNNELNNGLVANRA